MRVKFGDVVVRANTKEDRFNTDKLYYVGGEHIETGEYLVTKRGLIARSNIGPMFYFGFRKGQVLLASRSPDLKKAGMVTFDGICSEKTFVIETRDENVLLQSFLPIIVRSEAFWEYANNNQSGSVNHFINWSTFSAYEFDLPSLEEQRELSEIVWAMVDAQRAYKALIAASDELVKSQFIESFGDIISNDRKWPEKLLGEVAESRLGKMVDANKQTGKCLFPYIANFNVQWFSLSLEDLRSMDFIPEDQEEFSLRDGDLLVCEGGEVGRCAIWHNEIQPCFFQKAIHRIRCNNQYLIPEYLAYWFKSHSDYNQFEDVVGAKTSIAHLPGVKLKKLRIPLPPIDKQKAFKTVWGQLDKSKHSAQKALEDLQATQKALIRKYLG